MGGEGWPTRGEESRAAVEDAIATARASLRAAGFPVWGKRFPFPMHHDAYRVRIPRGEGGKRARHSDVARLLNAWAATRADPADYAWQAIEGALRSMVSQSPDLASRIPESVQVGTARVANGGDFLSWVAGASRSGPAAVTASAGG